MSLTLMVSFCQSILDKPEKSAGTPIFTTSETFWKAMLLVPEVEVNSLERSF